MKIETLHEFHDKNFSEQWANKFRPTPERMRLFETILQSILNVKLEKVSILELGIGPGFLADYLLKKSPIINYEGLDFSVSMLKIAQKRTEKYNRRIKFTQADLIKENWIRKINKIPDAIVSTWALHDLFNKENILSVYKSAYEILPKGGLFLNGDFIKPEKSNYEYEGGRIKPSEPLQNKKAANIMLAASYGAPSRT